MATDLHLHHDLPTTRDRRREASFSVPLAALIAWDAATVIVIFAVTNGIPGITFGGRTNRTMEVVGAPALLIAALAPLLLAAAGLYRLRGQPSKNSNSIARRSYLVSVSLAWVTLTVSIAAEWPVVPLHCTAIALLMPLPWIAGRALHDRASRERVLLIGDGPSSEGFVKRFTRISGAGDLVGYIGIPSSEGRMGIPHIGFADDLEAIVDAHAVTRVVVALEDGGQEARTIPVLRRLLARGLSVDLVPAAWAVLAPQTSGRSVGGLCVLAVAPHTRTRAQTTLKRAVDIAGAGVLLVVLAPLIAAVAVAVLVMDGRPVMFRQQRVGRGGRPFTMLKFRSMRTDADREGVALRAALADRDGGLPLEDVTAIVTALKAHGDSRVTRLGAILRATSLDELPQLVNVLRGDMSLVGPRPLRPFEVAGLTDWQNMRHGVRPGITGLWQVAGRSDVDWDERMHLDYVYAAHWTLGDDMRILARTLPAALLRDGAR